MIFLDANIIMYTQKSEYHWLLGLLLTQEKIACSMMTYLEVMGHIAINERDKEFLDIFFTNTRLQPISNEVVKRAVRIRRLKAIKSPDAIIAATCLMEKSVLWTNNIKDFSWIKDLSWHNPITGESSN